MEGVQHSSRVASLVKVFFSSSWVKLGTSSLKEVEISLKSVHIYIDTSHRKTCHVDTHLVLRCFYIAQKKSRKYIADT